MQINAIYNFHIFLYTLIYLYNDNRYDVQNNDKNCTGEKVFTNRAHRQRKFPFLNLARIFGNENEAANETLMARTAGGLRVRVG